jgi:hypothetical protein
MMQETEQPQRLAVATVVDSQRKKSSVDTVWEQAANTANGMDKTLFCELMNGLWSGMGRTVMPDKTTLRVWYLCLHQLTVEQFGTAIRRYLTERSSEFVNVQLILELSGAVETRANAALEAWQEAIDAVRIVGSYRSPAFSNPTTSHVIQSLGGWDWFCDQKPEQLREWVRGRFLKTFEALSVSAKTDEPVRLPNLLTKTGGEMVEMPARIGVSVERLAKRLASSVE